jgi:hypothetical protein
MSWDDVDKKTKKKIDAEFVSCNEEYELRYIFQIIKEEYPYLSDSTIWEALRHCCREIPAPRPRYRYMQCVRMKLGK